MSFTTLFTAALVLIAPALVAAAPAAEPQPSVKSNNFGAPGGGKYKFIPVCECSLCGPLFSYLCST